MDLWLDTEFNGFGGELISIGLVAANDDELYIVRNIRSNITYHPWVAENVLPRLAYAGHTGAPLDDTEFMRQFSLFAYKYRDSRIIADWPADIEHFCNCLTFGGMKNGFRCPANFTFRLIDRQHSYASELEHNALSDARALRNYCTDWKI